MSGSGSFVGYRVVCSQTTSGWAWDVLKLEFYVGERRVLPQRPIESGNAGAGYEAQAAVMSQGGGTWGGRKDANGLFWVGGLFPADTVVSRVVLTENAKAHASCEGKVRLQRGAQRGQGGFDWLNIEGKKRDTQAEIERLLLQRVEYAPQPLEQKGPVPRDSELVTLPSKRIRGKIHDVCYKAQLQPKRKVAFVPNREFYFAENCEGLWVCVSKTCGQDTLERACKFVRSVVPPYQRKLWGQFRSPKWAKDPGPMRLVVLDNRTNQQAGCIPELKDESKGRNGTSCPFVFTSREDFYQGVGPQVTQLTAHEVTHGADMVIRQLVDPYFHDQVTQLWAAHCGKFLAPSPRRRLVLFDDGSQFPLGGTASYRYAACNRDEFLAECLCIALGLKRGCAKYTACGMSTPEELAKRMPDVLALLRHHFIVT